MRYWSEIKSDHVETQFNATVDGAIAKIVYIDAWRPECELGTVIAKVVLTLCGDVIIIYIDNIARLNVYAQEVIQNAALALRNDEDSDISKNVLTAKGTTVY